MYQVDTYLQNTDRYDIGKKSLYRYRRRIKSSRVIIPISILVGKGSERNGDLRKESNN